MMSEETNRVWHFFEEVKMELYYGAIKWTIESKEIPIIFPPLEDEHLMKKYSEDYEALEKTKKVYMKILVKDGIGKRIPQLVLEFNKELAEYGTYPVKIQHNKKRMHPFVIIPDELFAVFAPMCLKCFISNGLMMAITGSDEHRSIVLEPF